MGKIFVFMNTSVDGYVEAPGHDISWAHGADSESFVNQEGREVEAVLFGHRTYEMMRSFWPTPQAAEMMPKTARFMNEKPKYVASDVAFEPGWSNVTVLHGDIIDQVRELKDQVRGYIAMFGSNILCASLVDAGLIDEFQIVVNPVILGQGTSLFQGLSKKTELALRETRSFPSGAVFLAYTLKDIA